MKKKFEHWSTNELQFVATLIAGRDLATPNAADQVERDLYTQIIFELRDRRVEEEKHQRRLF